MKATIYTSDTVFSYILGFVQFSFISQFRKLSCVGLITSKSLLSLLRRISSHILLLLLIVKVNI